MLRCPYCKHWFEEDEYADHLRIYDEWWEEEYGEETGDALRVDWDETDPY